MVDLLLFSFWVMCEMSWKLLLAPRNGGSWQRLNSMKKSDLQDAIHINDLPDTILLSVLSFLSANDRLQSAALVCTYWNNLIRDPYFWHACNFLEGNKKLDDTILRRVIKYSSNVKSLDLSCCPLVTDDGLQDAMDHCSSLRKLALSEGQHFTVTSLGSIGEKLRHLTSLNLQSCDQLTDENVIQIVHSCTQLLSLNVAFCDLITDLSIVAVADFCHNLLSLEVDGCFMVTDVSILRLMENERKLDKLMFGYSYITGSAMMLLTQMKSLRMLVLSSDVIDEILLSLVQCCTALQFLGLTHCGDITADGFILALPYFKNLAVLGITDRCLIDDKLMEMIGRYCKSLQLLDIKWSKNITDVGVQAVSEDCPILSNVQFYMCDNITKEVVTFLNDKYLHIIFEVQK